MLETDGCNLVQPLTHYEGKTGETIKEKCLVMLSQLRFCISACVVRVLADMYACPTVAIPYFTSVFFSSFEAIHSLETIHALSLGSGEFRLLFYKGLFIQRTLQTAPFIFPYRN